MATPIPAIPNSNVPIAREDGVISIAWQRAFAALFAATPIAEMLVVFKGTAAPVGWVHDTTVGLPALPAGMIWIRKI